MLEVSAVERYVLIKKYIIAEMIKPHISNFSENYFFHFYY